MHLTQKKIVIYMLYLSFEEFIRGYILFDPIMSIRSFGVLLAVMVLVVVVGNVVGVLNRNIISSTYNTEKIYFPFI
jgi:hypothetical protein